MKCFRKAAFSPPRAATCVWFGSSHSFAPRFPSQDILGSIQESQQLLKVMLALSVYFAGDFLLPRMGWNKNSQDSIPRPSKAM